MIQHTPCRRCDVVPSSLMVDSGLGEGRPLLMPGRPGRPGRPGNASGVAPVPLSFFSWAFAWILFANSARSLNLLAPSFFFWWKQHISKAQDNIRLGSQCLKNGIYYYFKKFSDFLASNHTRLALATYIFSSRFATRFFSLYLTDIRKACDNGQPTPNPHDDIVVKLTWFWRFGLAHDFWVCEE